MLLVLLNFPYLPHQLRLMRKSELEIAFISIVPEGQIETVQYIRRDSPIVKVPQKKPILGNDLDFAQNPGVHPPARWQALITQAPTNIPFNEIPADENFERLFRTIELEVMKIDKARSDFDNFVKRFPMRRLPSVIPNVGISELKSYLGSHPDDLVGDCSHQFRNRLRLRN
jgi:hypothetical protein